MMGGSTAHRRSLFHTGAARWLGRTEGPVSGSVGVAAGAERELSLTFDATVGREQPVFPASFVALHDVDGAKFACRPTAMQHYQRRTGFEFCSQSELPISSQCRR